MAVFTVKVHGLKELQDALKQLPPNVEKRFVRTAVREAAMPILHAARSNAPRDTGLLVSSLKVTTGFSKRKGLMTARVGTREGDYRGDTFYGSFIEYGHWSGSRGGKANAIAKSVARDLRRQSRKAGGLAASGTERRNKQEEFFRSEGMRKAMGVKVKPRTWVPPQPYLRPAFDENKGRAVDIFKRVLRERIEAYWKKIARRSAAATKGAATAMRRMAA